MEVNWKPLETKLGPKRCVGFMYMGRVNGIHLYKHGLARVYLNLDDRGQCYVCRGRDRYEKADFEVELAKLESLLTQIGETLESVYDDEYIARKDEALRKAGLRVVRLQVEPDEVTVN